MRKRRREEIKPQMMAFDFFCGAGGLTRGLLNAGINVVAGFDSDGDCHLSYEKNNRGVKFVEKDIRHITMAELRKLAGCRSFRDALFAGCAPCSPFSQQRKNQEPSNDATLLMEFGRIVAAAKPGYVLVENVPGLARVQGYSTFRRFVRLLETNGYKTAVEVLDAKRFGVPQNRRRLVLIATRKGVPSLPKPKYGTERHPFKTVRQAIARFPVLRAGSSHAKIANHVASAVTTINLERLRATPRDGGDRRDWPLRLQLECHSRNYEGHTDFYGRMFWDAPAPTLTGRCISISNGRYGHPTQNRAISLREAAALQSFPATYRFFGFRSHIALQIGNAVPVRLAKELGRHILWLRSQVKRSRP
ncbi:MAG: DNA cytosine methyltransferase [Terriglobia bacterium]